MTPSLPTSEAIQVDRILARRRMQQAAGKRHQLVRSDKGKQQQSLREPGATSDPIDEKSGVC